MILPTRMEGKLSKKQLEKCRRKMKHMYAVIGICFDGYAYNYMSVFENKRDAIRFCRGQQIKNLVPYFAVVRCSDIVRED